MDNQPVYIIDALRTPLGRVNGKLSAIPLSGLMRLVIEGLVQKHSTVRNHIDEVVFGNAVTAGAGQHAVRKALIDAGLPETVPGYSVGNVCASGLQALINACQAIQTQHADLIIAGGADSVSNMPELIFKKNHDIKKMKGLTESLMHDGLWCSISDRWMGLLCEDLARKERISKKEQDDYAFESYQKAALAQEQGNFHEEIIPLKMGGGKVLGEDETIRKKIKREVFDTFESAFEHKGTVTAGNSSAPCDGAAGILTASKEAADLYALRPLAEIVAYISVAGPARDVFRLIDKAVHRCLERAQLTLAQIDLFEISEAFAAQMVLMQRGGQISDRKLNIWGGDVALGHPLGAAGIRGLVTLIHALKKKNKHYGLACACLGGGGAIAVIVKRT
jgi:acetyl-CoA C-acetyltransferase